MADSKPIQLSLFPQEKTCTVVKAYRFRMRPTKAQAETMWRRASACRFVYNWGLERRKAHYAQTGKTLSFPAQGRELTELRERPEMAWLKAECRDPLKQALRDLDRAYADFFARRVKLPRFKSVKRTPPSFRHTEGVSVSDGCVRVPCLGWVRIRQSRCVEGKIACATFKRDACGHWHVTITAYVEMPDVALSPLNPARIIGIDAGLIDFVVTSDGEKVSAPKFYRKTQRKLARAQRNLCRRKKGSKRREKAKRLVARIHEKIRNQRSDFLHKLSADLIGRYDGICVESLSLKGLMRTKLAKSFGDAAHSEFRRQLQYKAAWHCKRFAAVDRFYPSTKTCGACGKVMDDLPLKSRIWTCDGCGATHDRDLNAARNIKAEGLRMLAAGSADS